MCAVIGIYSDKSYTQIRDIIVKLFDESQIRGKHAIGYTYIQNNVLVTRIGKLQSYEGIESEELLELEKVMMIGHCRYSTSDIEYNQPLSNEKISLVHNGVITQKDPEKWEQTYGFSCKGKNDSELILRFLESNKSLFNHALNYFKDSSIAAIELHNNRAMRFYRNGTRPLWYHQNELGIFISSTQDILRRTFGNFLFKKCESGCSYTLNGSNYRLDKSKYEEVVDIQRNLDCSNYYKSLL